MEVVVVEASHVGYVAVKGAKRVPPCRLCEAGLNVTPGAEGVIVSPWGTEYSVETTKGSDAWFTDAVGLVLDTVKVLLTTAIAVIGLGVTNSLAEAPETDQIITGFGLARDVAVTETYCALTSEVNVREDGVNVRPLAAGCSVTLVVGG
jgi:hypothetical protein